MLEIHYLTLFILSAFLGYEIITRIPTNLHTPLMSGANAISGITILGAVLVAGSGRTPVSTALGVVAVVMATVNVVGGYLVSQSMLEQFNRKGDDR